MRTTKEILVRGVLLSLFPAVCSCLGSTNILNWAQENRYIGENVNIELIKNILTLICVLSTFILLTRNLIIAELNEVRFRRQSTDLIRYTKEIMTTTLARVLGKEYCEINIRIFVPKKGFIWKLRHFFKREEKLEFWIKNIDGLADAGVTNNLKFRVLPEKEKQGLVGECFSSKGMVYDDNLVESNEKNYNLSKYQISKTNDLRFIIVCPTFSDDVNIDAIVAFDSKNDIKITEANKNVLINLVLNYTQQLHENIPELFKPKGGFL